MYQSKARGRIRTERILAALCAWTLLLSGGCKRPSAICSTAAHCTTEGRGGTCEPSGFCAYPDSDCPHGRRYSKNAPAEIREQCVKISVCGDGVWTAAEYCEDGNANNDDGCTKGCVTCDESIGISRFAGADGTCYSRYNEPLPWRKAQQVCLAIGGYLVTLASVAEQSEVEKHLLQDDGARLWLGQSYDSQQRVLTWLTGENASVNHFHVEGKPSPGPGRDCVTISAGQRPEHPDLRYLWSLEDCSNSRPFLCETPAWRVRHETNHAYRVVYGLFQWDEAEGRCQQLGAHLAAIPVEEEAAFLKQHFRGPAWIGAHDQQSEGEFQWVTGEPFLFKDFAPHEPDDYKGEHDCLLYGNDRMWYDRDCGSPNAALCELE